MFFTEDDNTVYVTRGDSIVLSLTAELDGSGEAYCFKAGDVVRIKVFEKKNCENVALQKDFGIEETTDTVQLTLTGDDTRIGGIISKPVDYWYEVELNPDTEPQTIIGYDDEGPRLLKLMPEGKDVDETPQITPQDIPVVDDELSLTSKRPVQNKVITGVIAELKENIGTSIKKEIGAAASQFNGDISLLKTRMDVLTSTKIPTSDIEQEVADARVEADGTVNSNLGEAVRNAYNKLLDIIFTEKIKKVDSLDLEVEIADGTYLTKLVTYKEASLISEESNGICAIVTYSGITDITTGKILNVWCFKEDKIYKLNYETEDFEELNKTVTVDSELSSSSRNPVENRTVLSALSDKVDKAEGKALSSNDFTDEYKLRVDGAEKTENKITEFAGTHTDKQYPSAKAVKAELDKKLNLSGGTMTGNLGMDGKDILNVKKIIFLSQNGEWLNMSNHPITNLATPTAAHHAVNKKYVDDNLSSLNYHPATLLDTTIAEEVAQIEITTLNGKAFNCNQFYVQLDIPATTTAAKINCNVRNATGRYATINPESSMLKTTTDAQKHNLIAFSYEQFGKIYRKLEYGGQIGTLSHSWNSIYNSVPMNTVSGTATNLDEAGTGGIKLTGLFPVGTIVKVWGGRVK